MMSSPTRFARTLALKFAVAAGSAGVLAAALTGCSSGTKPEPTKPPSSSAPAPSPSSPTEKNLSPTGGNSFTPSVKAPAADTAAPGRHRY